MNRHELNHGRLRGGGSGGGSQALDDCGELLPDADLGVQDLGMMSLETDASSSTRQAKRTAIVGS